MERDTEDFISESMLIRFFSGETSEEETKYIIGKIKASKECYDNAKEIYYIYYFSELKKAKKEVDIDVVFKSVQNRINKKKVNQDTARIFQLIQKIAVAIVIPLGIFTGYLLTNNAPNNQINYIEISAKRGMITKTVLPDSTIVWLNSGSTLKYPSSFSSKERNVELEGEAYFDVRKSEVQLFTINKGKNLSISVLGTEFNVEAYDRDDRIITTLVGGKVRVEYKNNQGSRVETHLTPSQKLVYDTRNKSVDIKDVSVRQYIAWKEGKIVFEDTNLKDALHMLSKHFNVDFLVKDQRLYSNAFTGKFEGERLDEILTIIKMSSNINYTYKQTDPFNEKRLIEIY